MRNTFILFSTLTFFFVIGTATSYDEPSLEYASNISLSGDNIVIISETSVDITEARISLINMPEADRAEVYNRSDYSLEGFATDTLPLSSFILNTIDSVPFPQGELPTSLYFEFFSSDTLYFKSHEF